MARIDRITLRDDTGQLDFAADNQLVFRASFTDDVINVTADDFNVTGTSGAAITQIEAVNRNNAQYDITVAGPSLSTFNGEVGIELATPQDIRDAGDNSPVPSEVPGNNQVYTLTGPGDTTPPAIASITRQTPGDQTTGADTLTFRVTFSENVQNVNADDFTVNGTTATITGVNPISASIYDVTISGGDLAALNGPVGLDLAGAQNITDLADNALPAGEPVTDEVYTVANATVPVLTDIERLAPATETTGSGTLVFRVTFSETVQGVDTTDFVVNGGTTATVTNVIAANNSNNRIYEVTVSGGNLAAFEGTVSLALAAQQDITSLANVPVPVAVPSNNNETYTAIDAPDTIAPVLTSIERLTPGTATTNADSLVFQVTFDENVQGVDAADFTVNGNTTATITEVVAVNERVYNITVSGGNLATINGPIGLDLATNQNITDIAGNDLPAGEPKIDQTYTVSNDPTQTAKGLLKATGNILEITRLVSQESLRLNIESSKIISVGELTVFATDANGNNRTRVAKFSILEGNVLPIDYAPSFSLTDSTIAEGSFLQFEIVEAGVGTRVATVSTVSETEVTLAFEGGTELTAALTTAAINDDLLLDDAAAIDLTGLTGTSQVRFTVYREAALDNTVGFYTTDFADGRIIIDDVTGATLSPGDEGYEAAALANRLDIQLSCENNQVNTFETTIDNGIFLATYVVIDGVDPAVGEVLFSHQGANTRRFDQIRQVGTNAFGY